MNPYLNAVSVTLWRSRRRMILALLLTAVVLVLSAIPAPPARASCVGPVFVVGADVPNTQPTTAMTVSRTRSITVSGKWFHRGCEDTVGRVGCAPIPPPDPESPLDNVDLILRQGSSSWVLGSSDAAGSEADYAIRWTGELPEDVKSGSATLSAAQSELKIVIAS